MILPCSVALSFIFVKKGSRAPQLLQRSCEHIRCVHTTGGKLQSMCALPRRTFFFSSAAHDAGIVWEQLLSPAHRAMLTSDVSVPANGAPPPCLLVVCEHCP